MINIPGVVKGLLESGPTDCDQPLPGSFNERALQAIQRAVNENNAESKRRGDYNRMEVRSLFTEVGLSAIEVRKYVVAPDSSRETFFYKVLKLWMIKAYNYNQLSAVFKHGAAPIIEDRPICFERFLTRVCDHVQNWKVEDFEDRAH